MADAHLSFANYGELLQTISSLCAEGRTGSLFIISETNCFARLVIAAGNIIYLEYRLRKGTDAIPLFVQIEHGTLDFKDGKVISHKAFPLPITSDLLALLGGKTAGVVSAPPAPPMVEKRPASDAFQIIEDELVDILGPMAALVWEEHLDRVGGPKADIDIEQLIANVATEIDDPDKAAQFRSHVHSMLV